MRPTTLRLALAASLALPAAAGAQTIAVNGPNGASVSQPITISPAAASGATSTIAPAVAANVPGFFASSP